MAQTGQGAPVRPQSGEPKEESAAAPIVRKLAGLLGQFVGQQAEDAFLGLVGAIAGDMLAAGDLEEVTMSEDEAAEQTTGTERISIHGVARVTRTVIVKSRKIQAAQTPPSVVSGPSAPHRPGQRR